MNDTGFSVTLSVDAVPLTTAITSASEVLEHLAEFGQAGINFVHNLHVLLVQGDVCATRLADDGVIVFELSERFAVLVSAARAWDADFMAADNVGHTESSMGCVQAPMLDAVVEVGNNHITANCTAAERCPRRLGSAA